MDINDFAHNRGTTSLTNNEWISKEETPDPSPLPSVKGWNIIVRPVPIKTETKGGIILPDQIKDDLKYLTNVARVLALGPLCYNDERKFGPEPWCKVGDLVALPKFAGSKFVYKGVKLTLISESDVLMVLEDAKDIDPDANI